MSSDASDSEGSPKRKPSTRTTVAAEGRILGRPEDLPPFRQPRATTVGTGMAEQGAGAVPQEGDRPASVPVKN
jgi:hypothetical protein